MNNTKKYNLNLVGTELEGKTEEEIYLEYEKYIGATIKRRVSGIQTIKNKYMLDYEDLYAFGAEGLISAIRSYDKNCNTSFKTYVFSKIKWKIYDRIKTDSIGHDSQTISLDSPIGSEEDNITIIDTIVSNEIESTEDDFIIRVSDALKIDEEADEDLIFIILELIRGKSIGEIAKYVKKERSTVARMLKSKKAMRVKNRLLELAREGELQSV